MTEEITDADGLGVLARSTLVRHSLAAIVGSAALFGLLESISDYRNTQLSLIALYVCAVAGLTMLVGQSGQISLGHGAFMLVGAYTFALLFQHWTFSPGNLELVVVLIGCVIVACLFGGVVGLAAARLRGPYLAGVTLAFAVGMLALPSYEKLHSQLGGNTGVAVLPPNPPGGFDLYKWRSVVCCAAAVLTLWFLANLARSRIGRSFRAVRDDEIAASLAGLSVPRVQVLAFVVSAGAAGLAGGLLAYIDLTAGPGAFPLSLSLTILAAAVFGGLGSLAGAVYGSILVALLPQWSTDLTSALSIHSQKITADLPLVVYGVVLAVAMLAFPQGLQGAVLRIRRLILPGDRSG